MRASDTRRKERCRRGEAHRRPFERAGRRSKHSSACKTAGRALALLHTVNRLSGLDWQRREHRLHRRRSGGAVLRAPHEAAGSRASGHGGRAQPPVRHLRLGRRVLRPDARQPARGRRAQRACDPRRLQPLGRHRRPHPRPHDPLERPRLLRHRAQAPAQHPAGALRRRSASSSCSRPTSQATRRIPTPTSSSRATGSTAASARATRRPTEPDIDLRPCRFVWLGTHKLFEAFTFAFEETPSTAGSRRMRIASTTPRRRSSSRRPRRCGSGRPRPHGQGRVHRVLRAALRALSRRPSPACPTPRTCAARRSGSAFRASSASTGCIGDGGAPVVLMGDAAHTAHFSDRLGHQARARGCDRARPLHRRRAGDLAARSGLRDACGASRCCASRTRRAIPPSGSRTSRATRTLPPEQFAYSLLTRSQRISHENLRVRDRGYRRRLRGLARRALGPRARRASSCRSRRCSRRSRCAA